MTRAPKRKRSIVDVENSNSREKQLQIVALSPPPFTLPDDWLVEQRRRISDPSHIDRYYIEPRTGHKFRSLVSVQRYLAGETRDYLPTERMVSENKHTTFKSRTGQKFRSTRDFEGNLTEDNECRAIPKLVFKCGSGKRSVADVQSYQNPLRKSFSVSKDQTTLKPSIQSARKINTGEDGRSSIHNLSRPPTKVSWVLSGPGGFWNPFLDDSIVPASEKLKWSKAFGICINEGVTN